MSDVDLRQFSISPLPYTGLFGVFLGCHAVADALHVLHTGVGCKGKTQRQLVRHDLGREAHEKVGWTELGEAELIRDVAAGLRKAVPELQARRQAAALLVTASAAVELTGADLEAAVREMEAELGLPVVLIPGAASAPDLYAGYGAVVQALVRMVDWSRTPDPRPTVSLVGHLFHRYEHEQAANLTELRRLVEGLGASLGPTFLAGESVATLAQAHAASALVRLPYAGCTADELSALTGRPVAACGLPMGLRGTANWLRTLAKTLDVGRGRVTSFIERGEYKTTSRLALARERLSGRRLAIVAEAPRAAGWVLLAQELGLVPALIVLTDRTLGGAPALEAHVAAAGGELPSDAPVVVDPSLIELREFAEEHVFDLAVRPDLSLAGSGWERIPTVETGFPANHKHFVFPLPELGYGGTVALAQRLLDAVGGVH
ncbi:MAG: nitrogenase component 1 [bacterium]